MILIRPCAVAGAPENRTVRFRARLRTVGRVGALTQGYDGDDASNRTKPPGSNGICLAYTDDHTMQH